jgi:predicted nuclease of predicted toxin-antitoxin system
MSRLLLDENLSPSLVDVLNRAGHDVVHVNGVGLNGQPDAVIMLWAAGQKRTVVTHDHDFVENLSALRAGAPSVIKISQRAADGLVGTVEHAEHLRRALPSLERRLRKGSVVVLNAGGFVAEPLPIDRGIGWARR